MKEVNTEMLSITGQSEDVKVTVLSVLDLQFNHILDSRFSENEDVALSYAKDLASHQLAIKVTRFVDFEVTERGHEKIITAKLHLPYVANERIKNLEIEASTYKSDLGLLRRRCTRYEDEIISLKHPWYKKLMSKLRISNGN